MSLSALERHTSQRSVLAATRHIVPVQYSTVQYLSTLYWYLVSTVWTVISSLVRPRALSSLCSNDNNLQCDRACLVCSTVVPYNDAQIDKFAHLPKKADMDAVTKWVIPSSSSSSVDPLFFLSVSPDRHSRHPQTVDFRVGVQRIGLFNKTGFFSSSDAISSLPPTQLFSLLRCPILTK